MRFFTLNVHNNICIYLRVNIAFYFDSRQFFGRVGKVPKSLQSCGRSVVMVFVHQEIRRLGYAQCSDQMEKRPNGTHQAKRYVLQERAERVRQQYAGYDEELKYRSQTTCEHRCIKNSV